MPIPSFALRGSLCKRHTGDIWGAGQGSAGTWLCPAVIQWDWDPQGGCEAEVTPHTTSPSSPLLLRAQLLPCVGDLDAGTDIINRFSFSPCHRSRS